MTARPQHCDDRLAQGTASVAAPRPGRRLGVRLQLLLAVAVMLTLGEALVCWWQPDCAAPDGLELAIRLALGLALAAWCWRLMHRPVQALQAAVTGGTVPQHGDVPVEWQPLLQALGAWAAEGFDLSRKVMCCDWPA